MLARLTVTAWENKPGVDTRIVDKTNGDTILFNGNRINGILVRASTKASFLFTDRLNDPREKPSYVEVTQSAANVVTYSDLGFQSLFATVNIYPDNVVTATPVATRINSESVAYVYKDRAKPATRSWIVYSEGGRLRTVICNYSINQVYSLFDDANLTTS